MALILTEAGLHRKNPCVLGVSYMHRKFPDLFVFPLRITKAVCLEVHHRDPDFSYWDWAARNVLTPDAYREYSARIVPAVRERSTVLNAVYGAMAEPERDADREAVVSAGGRMFADDLAVVRFAGQVRRNAYRNLQRVCAEVFGTLAEGLEMTI